MRIYLPRMVHGDWPFGHHLIAEKGIHEAVSNPHGAVSVVLPDGQLLGVKPDEFWLIQEGELKSPSFISSPVVMTEAEIEAFREAWEALNTGGRSTYEIRDTESI